MNDNLFDTDHQHEDENWISRSQRKRDVEALQKLGERMVELRPDQLDKLPIDESLRAAIDEAKRLSARSALRRQMQYIGKLMRHEDGDVLQAAMDRFDVTKKEHNQVFHKLEKWRERLINHDAQMMEVILSEYPHTDIQHLRQLVRNAQREATQNKPPAAAKKLFKYLRELEETK